MTILTSAYTVGSNQPLNHARILYAPISGTVSASGTTPEYALNDYTSQRWRLNPGLQTWDLISADTAQIDSVFVAAHNLAGRLFEVWTAAAVDALGPELVTNGTFPTDTNGWVAGNGSTISVTSGQLQVTNGGFGNAFQQMSVVVGRTYRVRATVSNGTGTAIFAIGTPTTFNLYGGFAAGVVDTNIVATDTTLLLVAYVDSVTAGLTALFDNISVQLVEDYTLHYSQSITDNSAICALFNNAGTPYSVRRVRIAVNDGTDIAIGIIRAGLALQMPIPIYGGHRPLNLNRVTEAQQQFSETGQWLGRIIKRRAVTSAYEWEYLTPAWYDTYFEPFAQTLPLKPFCIAGNPSKIASDVGFVWTDRDVEPVQMGIQAFRSVSLNVTGYY